MFPPGRARLGTRPVTMGSATIVITMGIVAVACLAAKLAGVVSATMMSTLRRTSSAARPGSHSGRPSAYRYSMAMSWPSA